MGDSREGWAGSGADSGADSVYCSLLPMNFRGAVTAILWVKVFRKKTHYP